MRRAQADGDERGPAGHPAGRPPDDAGTAGDVFGLLAELTDLLLSWSYEGTAGNERTVVEVRERYGVRADVTFLPDSAVLTVGDRTTSRSATPLVPPLNQVSALKRLLAAVVMTVSALLLGRRPSLPPPYVLYLGT